MYSFVTKPSMHLHVNLVLKLTTRGTNVTQLYPHVCKLLATSDLLVKKMVYWYISEQEDNGEFVLLCINGLLKDCSNSNPVIRGMALKTLASIHSQEVVQHAVQPVLHGLKDQSAYVRRAAVMACGRIFEADRDAVVENGLVDLLYKMIRDQDPLVVTNTLTVLDQILAGEGGVVINKTMAHFLLNKLETLTESGLFTVFSLLPKYKAKTEEETIEIMNICDAYLKHSTVSVVLATLSYFMKLVEQMPYLHSEVVKRAQPQIFSFLSSGHHELITELLQFLEPLVQDHKGSFQASLKSFFCKYNEPAYLKLKKMSFLPRLVSEENCGEIVQELCMCCSDVDIRVTNCAISMLGDLAKHHCTIKSACISKFVDLLKSSNNSVCCQTLQVLCWLDLKDSEHLDEIAATLPSCMDCLESSDSMTAFATLLGQYAEQISDAPYLLEVLLSSLPDEPDSELLVGMLAASVRLFLLRPAECQEMLGQLLQQCAASGDVEVRDRLVYYYQVLRQPEQAKLIMAG